MRFARRKATAGRRRCSLRQRPRARGAHHGHVRDASCQARGTSVRTFTDVGKSTRSGCPKIDGDKESPYSELKVFRRQDLPRLYIHDGACIAIRADVLDESRNRLDDNFAIFGNDRRAVVQGASRNSRDRQPL